MAKPIGIDLGTTNSALAYIDLPRWKWSIILNLFVLPSLYLRFGRARAQKAPADPELVSASV